MIFTTWPPFTPNSPWNQGQIGNKTCCILKVGKFSVIKGYLSMFTGFKVSTVACKCVFYRPEHNAKGYLMGLNFEVLQIQKWNIPTDRAEIVDEKNGVIYLFIMLSHKFMVIKISKIA